MRGAARDNAALLKVAAYQSLEKSAHSIQQTDGAVRGLPRAPEGFDVMVNAEICAYRCYAPSLFYVLKLFYKTRKIPRISISHFLNDHVLSLNKG
jgi:hypothetical protein